MNRKEVRYTNGDSRTTESIEPDSVGHGSSADPELLAALRTALRDARDAAQDAARDQAAQFADYAPSAAALDAAEVATRAEKERFRRTGKRVCGWCFRDFAPKTKTQVYCSTNCRVKAWQHRNR